MFLGQYQHTIDSKNRLMIPARYRELLADGAYITQGLDQNLMVMTKDAFEAMAKWVNQKSMTDPSARLLKRIIFGMGVQAETDSAGRILIPQFLRTAAELDGDVILVGAGTYFEIWGARKWAAQLSEIQDSGANAERFIEFDIPTV